MADKTRFGIVQPPPRDPEKPPHPKRCETCRHFDPPSGAKDTGQCLANYPVVMPVAGNAPGMMGAVSLFPPMKPHERCSKWVTQSPTFEEKEEANAAFGPFGMSS